MAPAGSLFTPNDYDRDAPEYESVNPSSSRLPLRGHRRTISAITDDTEADDDYTASAHDRAVLLEEEEREKLLSRSIFSSLGRSGSNPVRIGKKVKGARRKAGELALMMGGKRLGMEDGSESESGSDYEGEKLLVGEKEMLDKKPRKPTLRRIVLFTTTSLSFLFLLISLSLYLSPLHASPPLLTNGTHPYHPTTILLSLDGLRADMLSPTHTPHLFSLSTTGLSPPYMLPSFPSVTFPNHFTLATGLLPKNHGLISNTFFSPSAGSSFTYTSPTHSLQPHWWTQNPRAQPIWKTLERAGGIGAVHMWPGSEVPGLGATYVDKFNGTESLTTKISSIVEYLDIPLHERPRLVAAYIPNVDAAGHKYGPNATETSEALKDVDDAIAQLSFALSARNLTDIVNLILVSDHGMASTDNSRLIHLSSLVNTSQIEHIDGWPLFALRPFSQFSTSSILASIKQKHTEDSPWDVYTPSTFPPQFNFSSSNPRYAPIWIVPRTGWAIVTDEEIPKEGEVYHPRGIHGYDNHDPLMRAFFIASGGTYSSIRKTGKNLRVFQNTEVYALVAESLGLRGVDGGDATVKGFEELLVDTPLESPDSESEKDDQEEEEETRASSAPSPTSTPTPTSTPAIGVTPPQDTKDTRTWWELLKDKAKKAKDRVVGWWDEVWVKDGPGHGDTGEKKEEGEGKEEKGKEKEGEEKTEG